MSSIATKNSIYQTNIYVIYKEDEKKLNLTDTKPYNSSTCKQNDKINGLSNPSRM